MLPLWPTLTLALALAPGTPAQDAEGVAFYEARVRPLLVERCSQCHGPEKRKGDMRLDTPSGIRAGSGSGPVVVGSDVAASKLLRAVSYSDPELQMPPDGKLSQEQIAVLVRWVERGAPLPEDGQAGDDEMEFEARLAHWSFQPVIASRAGPLVVDGTWPRSAADRFVLARIEDAGLRPAREASRATWLRRVTFDLTGLPPTPDEVAAFEADLAPGAHRRVVERLLASPAYGEAWARHWLDLVRYAETKGHEFDYPIPNAWQYRDYVVRAFDADVPFDRFVTEHVAGDLLDEPRRHPEQGFDESVLGTGFWWLGEEMHSPVDVRKDETDRMADQVDTFGKAFLGLTLACARCHDHMFDPIRQRDYYALCGYLVSSHYRQVRFDAAEHNGALAQELAGVRAQHSDEVRRTVGEALSSELADLESYLLACFSVERDREAGDPAPGPVPEERGFVVEDFEGGTWRGWTTEGEAFGAGPLRVGELAAGQGDVGAIGDGLLNTHNVRREDGVQHSDEPVGTLTSDPFVVRRDYLHFLVGGGQRPDLTAIQLLSQGEVVQQVTGENSNRMRHARFDVKELRGREVQLRVIDRWTKGWGHIGLDHVVQSNLEGPEALRVRFWEDGLAARLARIEGAARAFELDPERLELIADLVDLAGPESPLAMVVRAIDGAPARGEPEDSGGAAGAVVRVDYTGARSVEWITDGPTFGTGPVPAGAVQLSSDPNRPVRRVQGHGAAEADPVWNVLEITEETEREPGALGYVRAGRTLITPTFRLDGGKLHYLVRGVAKVWAAVDSHKMIQGPLHAALVRNVDGGAGFSWVGHDLSDYAGHRLHLEFTPIEPTDFGLSMVVEGEAPPSLSSGGVEGPVGTPEELVGSVARHLRAAAQLLASGDGDPALASSANWLLDAMWPGGAPPSVIEATASMRTAEESILARIARRSRTAPAMLDGGGADEPFLVRGSSGAPGDEVPRAFIAAVVGDDPPRVERGSGRLELARILVGSENPFVARAWVNRVWHHLFGRGLARSVDDLGHMGEPPTHPALLDHLARRFMDEHGWSTKRLVSELVLAATYRQASVGEGAADAADPANLLWHRANVRPIPAEALRDAILATSGELDPKRFGPPVPVYLTEFMQGRGRPGKSGPLDGHGRRSLYLAVRRNFLTPLFLVFDFPLPSSTVGRRTASNVPAQALALLNDPFVAEQAERWAARELEAGWTAGPEGIERLFRRACGRPPTDLELADAQSFLAQQAEGYPGQERDLRALADLCHVLFNVKEYRFLR